MRAPAGRGWASSVPPRARSVQAAGLARRAAAPPDSLPLARTRSPSSGRLDTGDVQLSLWRALALATAGRRAARLALLHCYGPGVNTRARVSAVVPTLQRGSRGSARTAARGTSTIYSADAKKTDTKASILLDAALSLACLCRGSAGGAATRVETERVREIGANTESIILPAPVCVRICWRATAVPDGDGDSRGDASQQARAHAATRRSYSRRAGRERDGGSCVVSRGLSLALSSVSLPPSLLSSLSLSRLLSARDFSPVTIEAATCRTDATCSLSLSLSLSLRALVQSQSRSRARTHIEAGGGGGGGGGGARHADTAPAILLLLILLDDNRSSPRVCCQLQAHSLTIALRAHVPAMFQKSRIHAFVYLWYFGGNWCTRILTDKVSV